MGTALLLQKAFIMFTTMINLLPLLLLVVSDAEAYRTRPGFVQGVRCRDGPRGLGTQVAACVDGGCAVSCGDGSKKTLHCESGKYTKRTMRRASLVICDTE